MKTQELITALAAADVDQNYRIRGHLVGWTHDGTPYLDELADGRWVVGYIERGVEFQTHFFASEDEACRYFYEERTRPRAMPRTRTPEEVAADDEHMRQWWADYHRRGGTAGR